MLKKLWHKLVRQSEGGVKKSLRQRSAETGIAKSTIHYQDKKKENRNKYSESEFWETQAGQNFLKRLIVGVIYTFGIKGGVGAGRIEEFMHQIRLGTHVGISETSIYRMMKEIEVSILKYKELEERKLKAESKAYLEELEVVLGLDETWLAEMLLVCQELTSGYIFLKYQVKAEAPKAGGDI